MVAAQGSPCAPPKRDKGYVGCCKHIVVLVPFSSDTRDCDITWVGQGGKTLGGKGGR
jgi:hypothetical protein